MRSYKVIAQQKEDPIVLTIDAIDLVEAAKLARKKAKAIFSENFTIKEIKEEEEE